MPLLNKNKNLRTKWIANSVIPLDCALELAQQWGNLHMEITHCIRENNGLRLRGVLSRKLELGVH